MGDEAALALAFAEAISPLGDRARLVESENDLLDNRLELPEAVASGWAYAVYPHDGVIVLDLDSEEAHEWGVRARAWLAEQGCRFVLTASGGGPRCHHLWVILPVGWDPEFVRSSLKGAVGKPPGNALRAGGMPTRPPFSPHRSESTRSIIIEPDVETALALFRSAKPDQITTLKNMSRWLDPSAGAVTADGRLDRGTTVLKVALSARNNRWPFQWFKDAVLDSAVLAAKYGAMSAGALDVELRRKWNEAGVRVRENPPVANPQVTEFVNALRATIPRVWTANQRSVYNALLDIATACGNKTIKVSERRLALDANLSTNGARTALVDLAEAGAVWWPDKRPQDSPQWWAEPWAYTLLPLEGTEEKAPSQSNSLPRGAGDYCSTQGTLYESLLRDVFSNRGLGLSVRETWETLPERSAALKIAELVPLLPGLLRHRTVARHLRRLKRAGLAENEGHRWWRLEPAERDLLDLARRLGVEGRGTRLADRFKQHGKQFQERYAVEYGDQLSAGRGPAISGSAGVARH